MKKWEKGPCKICGTEFVATQNGAKYCCKECRKKAKNKLSAEHQRRYREDEKREKDSIKRKRPKISINKVIAFCTEYEKRTGRYLPYGKAVVMMERGI